MSYILQALQRAEAERNRGTTPGLNTPTLPGAVAAPNSRRGLPWVAVGAAALLGGALVAWWLWPTAPAAVAPVAPLVAQAPATAPAPVPDKPPAQTLPATPIVAAPLEPAPAPVAKTDPPPAPRRPASAPAAVAQAQPPAQATPAPVSQPAPAASAVAPLMTLAELPPSLRQSLPPLNVGGGVYSPEPANRMLIVNGQVLREKAQLGPELVLESIGPRSAVFRIRGQRFEVRY